MSCVRCVNCRENMCKFPSKKAWKNLCKIVHSMHGAKLHSFGSNRQWSPHAPVVYVAIFTGPSHLSCLGIQMMTVKMKFIINTREGVRSGIRFCSEWTFETEKNFSFEPEWEKAKLLELANFLSYSSPSFLPPFFILIQIQTMCAQFDPDS